MKLDTNRVSQHEMGTKDLDIANYKIGNARIRAKQASFSKIVKAAVERVLEEETEKQRSFVVAACHSLKRKEELSRLRTAVMS